MEKDFLNRTKIILKRKENTEKWWLYKKRNIQKHREHTGKNISSYINGLLWVTGNSKPLQKTQCGLNNKEICNPV